MKKSIYLTILSCDILFHVDATSGLLINMLCRFSLGLKIIRAVRMAYFSGKKPCV